MGANSKPRLRSICTALAIGFAALMGIHEGSAAKSNATYEQPAAEHDLEKRTDKNPGTAVSRTIPLNGALQADRGCPREHEERQSDLCAQWKAADAAAEAAVASQRQVWIGGVGLVLGLLTLVAAAFAAYFAKRAATATEDTVAIARDTALAAISVQRPWLRLEVFLADHKFDNPDCFSFREGTASIIFNIRAKNLGGRPATNVQYFTSFCAFDTHAEAREFDSVYDEALAQFRDDPWDGGYTVFPDETDEHNWGVIITNFNELVSAEPPRAVKFVRFLVAVKYYYAGGEGFTGLGGVINGSVGNLRVFQQETARAAQLNITPHAKAQKAE